VAFEIASQSPGIVPGGTPDVRISSADEPLNGMTDDVRIYNVALSADEVAALAREITAKRRHITIIKSFIRIMSRSLVSIGAPGLGREENRLGRWPN